MTGVFVKAGFVPSVHDLFHRKTPLLIKFICQINIMVKIIYLIEKQSLISNHDLNNLVDKTRYNCYS